MTELQASLIAIGSAIVVGVISYNKWQEYKARKNVDRAFSTSHDDVLMTSPDATAATINERQEPGFGQETSYLREHDLADVDDALSQSSHQPRITTANPASPPHVSSKELPVDRLVDCAIPLALDGPMRGEKILPTLQSLRHVGNKPVHYIGLRDDGVWEPITHGGAYTALLAGVQLANRTNALNELEYSELITRLRQLGDELGAEADVPDMSKVMLDARGLHQFVNEFGAQLSVNVQANGAPWAINTLLTALERQGFDLRPDGRLIMSDGDSGVLFSLSTNVTLAAETTVRLTLLLDVPCVAPWRDGFGAMIACAKSLAARLDGTVVDDANQPLSDEAMAEIATQVNAFYGEMEAAEIPAGSIRAMRLFS